ncbi:MAG: hypothetical protein LBU83_12495 [Bacteroidales bacterium]|jgi:DNA-binding LytR/AlgR family response regulator|nr:hypothetical protein [Bacteroidales bacterium]
MVIKLEQDMTKKDIEVTIKYPVMNKTVDRIFSLVKSADTQIECFLNESIKLINASEIYYVESVDKKQLFLTKNTAIIIKIVYIKFMRNFQIKVLFKLVNIA